MSKKKTKATADMKPATPVLLKKVDAVIAEADSHRYSVSRVYAAHNEAYGLREIAQVCSSCLRIRVRRLRAWRTAMGGAAEKTGKTGKKVTGNFQSFSIQSTLEPFLAARGVDSDSPRADRRAALKAYHDAYAASLTPIELEGLEKAITAISLDAPDTHVVDTDEVTPQYDDPSAPWFVAPAVGVTRYPMGEGYLPLDFTPGDEDPDKGTIIYADGSKVKAGTYTTATGHEIAVQPGGRASIKDIDIDLT